MENSHFSYKSFEETKQDEYYMIARKTVTYVKTECSYCKRSADKLAQYVKYLECKNIPVPCGILFRLATIRCSINKHNTRDRYRNITCPMYMIHKCGKCGEKGHVGEQCIY